MHFGITKRPTTDYISPYNNAGLVSKLSEKYPPKTLEIAVSTTPLSFDARPGEPLRIFSQVLYRQKLKTLTYILPLIVWVYLHSIFCGGLRKTQLLCNRMRIGRSKSSKVADFGTTRKGVCNFLVVINCNCGRISHRF